MERTRRKLSKQLRKRRRKQRRRKKEKNYQKKLCEVCDFNEGECIVLEYFGVGCAMIMVSILNKIMFIIFFI